MNVLISSCFILPTRYDGKAQDKPEMRKIIDLLHSYKINIIPVCPEQLGGLSTPRLPAEITGGRVIAKDGSDVTINFQQGANLTCKIAEESDIGFAVLKEGSPSCGSRYIYDGTHSGEKISGHGITTLKLLENQIPVFSEHQIIEIEEFICKQKI